MAAFRTMRRADHPPSPSRLHKGSRIELVAALLAVLVLVIVDGVVLLLHSW